MEYFAKVMEYFLKLIGGIPICYFYLSRNEMGMVYFTRTA